MSALESGGTVEFAENYKKSKKSPFVIADESNYALSLVFSDGERYIGDSLGPADSELESFFYRLA